MEIKTFKDVKRVLRSIDPIKYLDMIFRQSEVKKTMIEFNHDQLQDGTDALGQTIITIGGSPYRATTIRIKRAKNQPTNKVTLKDTGEFYKTFKVVINKDSYEITANFEIHQDSILDNFYSSYDFLGLDKESLTELADQVVYPRLGKLIKEKIGI